MLIDNSRLQELCDKCLISHNRYNIGTYKEKTQHLILKCYLEENLEYHEVPVGGYIADILKDGEIIEIQTSGFKALRSKLEVFLSLGYKVTVVYPIAAVQNVCWIDPESGESFEGRFSSYPKAQYKLIPELLSIAELLEGVTVRCLYLKSSLHRLLDGYGPDRKKRATKLDRIPLEILFYKDIASIEDLKSFLPFESGEELTNAEISKRLRLKRTSLWRAVKAMEILGVLEKNGKKGNAIIYNFK